MKNLRVLLFALAGVFVSPLSADERSEVAMKLLALKKEFANRLSEIESEEFRAENKRVVEAKAAVDRALKLDEVKKWKATSVAQHKKVEVLVHRLVVESGEEGKMLVEKIKKLEARYQELNK